MRVISYARAAEDRACPVCSRDEDLSNAGWVAGPRGAVGRCGRYECTPPV
jgi:hypothetical protein